MLPLTVDAKGAICSPQYRYAPSALLNSPVAQTHAAYVIGCLYGNVFALREILRMQKLEERSGFPVSLDFNGNRN